VTKKTKSPHLPDLQLVEFDVFNRAIQILQDRSRKNECKRKTALRTQDHNLLAGNIFCGHCGNRLSSAKWQDKKRRKDGSLYVGEPKYKYSCFNKSQKRVECDGQNTYNADTVEHIVIEITKTVLQNFKQAPKDVSIEWRVGKRIFELQKAEKEVQQKLKRQQEQLVTLQAEVGKCLLGQSHFTQDVLANSIEAVKDEIDQIYRELSDITDELQNQTVTKESINRYYDEFDSWVDEFEKAARERKRMILCELYDRIEVRKDYQIAVYINPKYKQFLASEDGVAADLSDAV
jgi:chaperonin cofactor prefoldin